MKIFAVIAVFLSLFFSLITGCTSQNDLTARVDHQNQSKISLYFIGEFNPDDGDEYVTEISAYDPGSKRLCITDGTRSAVRLVDISDPSRPQYIKLVDLGDLGEANSVASNQGFFAIAVNAKNPQKNGFVIFINPDGEVLNRLQVGAMPDMVTFTPDGNYLLVANEGEPNEDYSVDPAGSVSIISINTAVEKLDESAIRTVSFSELSREEMPEFVRIIYPGASPAEDIEPEYISVTADSKTAIVSLQENNALAEIDIPQARLRSIYGLPWKDFSLEQNAFDASDEDGGISLRTWPVWGIPMPDSVSVFEVDGVLYVATANEGDYKDYQGFSEVVRVDDLNLDPTVYPNATELQKNENLGRLTATRLDGKGNEPEKGIHQKIFSFGTRSFSIYSIASGKLRQVYDSENLFERHAARNYPEYFNANNNDQSLFDTRSDNKGPEPESLEWAEIDGNNYLFVSLERTGEIYAFSMVNPESPELESVLCLRPDATEEQAHSKGDHIGPEGLCFIPAAHSPTGKPLLVVTYEVSGSIAILEARQSGRTQ